MSLAGAVSIASAASSTSSSVKAQVRPAASAAQQLAEASRLWQEMDRTPAPQKMNLFAQTWSNLTLVRKAWPNDKVACVRSGIMQADLAGEFGILPKAVDALLEVLPAAAKTPTEPQVERRLGQAYEQAGNTAESEKHFLAAERALHATHLNRVESQATLSSIALFYSRQNKPQEAIRRFREAENLPGQDLVNQTRFQLSVAQEAARLSKDAAAPELAHFDDLVAAARRTTLSSVDATVLNHMVQHAQRIREMNHL
jgi:tetratricopeptide (TPR) repeat protein